MVDWKGRLVDFLIPRMCAECREDIPFPLSGPLCGECLHALKPLENPICRLRDIAVHAVFPYRQPLRSLIHAFKYNKRRKIGDILGNWMAGVYPRIKESETIEAIVSVPLHPNRERQRGFNQAAILAGQVARMAQVPILDALTRVRNTKPQWGLAKQERYENLRNAFQLNPGYNVRGISLLLIDDVCTTGGTLEECAQVLKSAGVRNLRAFVLARD